MLFVTVGAQMAFDRLIRTVDEWAARAGCSDVLAQVGPADWLPEHIAWVRSLGPDEFREHVAGARAVVAHAGMGTILTALELGKPILVLPRRAALQETRNDHQLATAKHLLAQGRVHVAFDDTELLRALDRLDEIQAGQRICGHASPELISTLQTFLQNGRLPEKPVLGRTAAVQRVDAVGGRPDPLDLRTPADNVPSNLHA